MSELRTTPARPAGSRRGGRSWLFHAVMIPLTLLWLSPIAFVVVVSTRTFDDIALNGLSSLPKSFTLDAFPEAFADGGVGRALYNSTVITLFGVLFSLAFGSMAAYGLSRYRIPGRRAILLTMLAGNLLPPQILLIPVSKITESLHIYNTLLAVIAVQVGFGLGFYTFVLHGFMRSLPEEIFEAARVDGCGPVRTFWSIILPLCRPSLAALAALATTWIFNELLWAMTVLQSQSRFPVTAALLTLQGSYASSWNLLAAASLLAAIPPAIVFFIFQKQFVSGLMVGSVK